MLNYGNDDLVGVRVREGEGEVETIKIVKMQKKIKFVSPEGAMRRAAHIP